MKLFPADAVDSPPLPTMWWHMCRVERDMLATAKRQPCSWCGRWEGEPPEIRELGDHDLERVGTAAWPT